MALRVRRRCHSDSDALSCTFQNFVLSAFDFNLEKSASPLNRSDGLSFLVSEKAAEVEHVPDLANNTTPRINSKRISYDDRRLIPLSDSFKRLVGRRSRQRLGEVSASFSNTDPYAYFDNEQKFPYKLASFRDELPLVPLIQKSSTQHFSVPSLWSAIRTYLYSDLIETQHSHIYGTFLNFSSLIIPLEHLQTIGIAYCFYSLLDVFLIPLRLFFRIWFDRRRFAKVIGDQNFAKATVLFLALFLLSQVHMSRAYHHIRGQSVLKLYVIFNMLQLLDKLLCSVGADLIDSYASCWQRNRQTVSFPMQCWRLLIAAVYTFVHALLLFCMSITLNVSINSDNSSLVVLLISNNFVELKSSVFKKSDASSIMQTALSDAVERTQLIILLLVVFTQNITYIGWKAGSAEWLEKAIWSSALIFVSELSIDWIKHGFICKFNHVDYALYRNILIVIARDFLRSLCPKLIPPMTIDRRFGFPTFPIAVMVMRVCWQAISHSDFSFLQVTLMLMGGLLLLVIVRILLASFLLIHSFLLVQKNMTVSSKPHRQQICSSCSASLTFSDKFISIKHTDLGCFLSHLQQLHLFDSVKLFFVHAGLVCTDSIGIADAEQYLPARTKLPTPDSLDRIERYILYSRSIPT